MDILDGVLGDAPEAGNAPEPQVIETTTEQAGPARGADGKFTSAPAEPAPQAEPIAEPQGQAPAEQPTAVAPAAPETAKPDPGFVPITALLDTRDKLKAAEERARQLEADLAKRQAQPAPQPMAPPPSVFDDEAGYHEYMQAQVQQVALNTRLEFSEELARGKHGDEKVDAAKAWALEQFAKSPAFQQEVLAQRNPYEHAVKLFDREQLISKVDPTEYDTFLAWKASQASAAQAQPTLTAPAVVTPPAPSPSLAAAPSAGGATIVPSGPGQAFDQIFR